jgi:SAM-dependent methyltransferase
MKRLASDFDVNGALGMYRMHLLGTDQWRRLLGNGRIASCLDVGAGSGDVTARLAPLCDQVHTTEVSRAMAWRLRRRGFACSRVDVTAEGAPQGAWDLVTCLNVLDRCARPKALIEAVRRALAPGGRLVLSLVLPYDPFYYDGARTPEPEEKLACTSAIWEVAAGQLLLGELPRFGLEAEAFTRAPYLSAGDARRERYVLDAVVAVFKPVTDAPAGAPRRTPGARDPG